MNYQETWGKKSSYPRTEKVLIPPIFSNFHQNFHFFLIQNLLSYSVLEKILAQVNKNAFLCGKYWFVLIYTLRYVAQIYRNHFRMTLIHLLLYFFLWKLKKKTLWAPKDCYNSSDCESDLFRWTVII